MAQEQQSQSDPGAGLTLNTPTYEGCFTISNALADQGLYTYQAMGWCQPWCVRQNKPILGFSNGTNCWCGDTVPPASQKVADSNCNTSCSGYPQDTCGGSTAFAIWNDGLNPIVSSANTVSSPSSTTLVTTPSATDSTPSVVTVASTVLVTGAAQTSAQVIYTTEAVVASSGPNKAAIAAGVVVGVVGFCAVIGGILLWLRQKRRREIEEEHRRKEKPGSSSGSQSLTDSRLEPSVMFQRRMSDGSIADNQDYSRRILKVTNPDGS
ncbi:hypothetical protein MMC34_005352 [Xylographa carneopallida]|nr:hypothetical protein [Xylographa carneopallida]